MERYLWYFRSPLLCRFLLPQEVQLAGTFDATRLPSTSVITVTLHAPGSRRRTFRDGRPGRETLSVHLRQESNGSGQVLDLLVLFFYLGGIPLCVRSEHFRPVVFDVGSVESTARFGLLVLRPLVLVNRPILGLPVHALFAVLLLFPPRVLLVLAGVSSRLLARLLQVFKKK